ncbi:MAG: lipid II flippase MurJ, partial [Oceanococcaceae bacterium]
AALRAYALGLLGFSYVKILFPAYSSRQDTRTPVRIGLMALSVGMVFNLSTVGLALLLGYAGAHWLLALGTSVAACLNAGLLWARLPPALREGLPLGLLGRLLLASVLMGALLWQLRTLWPLSLEPSALERAGPLALLIGAGLLAYSAFLLLMGVRPAQLLRARGAV